MAPVSGQRAEAPRRRGTGVAAHAVGHRRLVATSHRPAAAVGSRHAAHARRPQRPSRDPRLPARPGRPVGDGPSRAEHRRLMQRRRTRLMLGGAGLLSVIVLVVWFPFSALMHQRQALAATNSQLSELRQADRGLQQEKKNLAEPSEVARIARQQYQLVSPGQQVYQVLPPSDSGGKATDPYSGDPGLKGPVSPSAEEPPGTSVSGGTERSGTASTGGHGVVHTGLLERIAQTLEFWR